MYPDLERAERVLRPLNYGTHGVPGRGWGIFSAMDGTDLAVINLQGRSAMIPIENPFTDVDRLLDEASEALPPVRLVDFHCELTSEKQAMGIHLDGRASRGLRDAHARPDGRRADPPEGDGVPVGRRDDRAAQQRDRVRPGHGAAAVHERPAHALRGGGLARRLQRPPGGRGPGHRARARRYGRVQRFQVEES